MSARDAGQIDSWLAFWNAPNRIYVNSRHKQAHYDTFFIKVKSFLPLDRGATVLDWGCGDALAAERIAELCRAILLYDAAEATRTRLANSYRDRPHIKVLDDSGLASLAANSVDIVIVNSVIQYLTREQLDEMLKTFHRLLRPEGMFLLGDVIEPHTPMRRDAGNLLRFAWRNGFFVAAVFGLMRTFASQYRKLRRELGFARYTRDEISRILRAAGFAAEILDENIAPSRYRRSYIARKTGKKL